LKYIFKNKNPKKNLIKKKKKDFKTKKEQKTHN